jgi:preprotein translocase subunit SecG
MIKNYIKADKVLSILQLISLALAIMFLIISLVYHYMIALPLAILGLIMMGILIALEFLAWKKKQEVKHD